MEKSESIFKAFKAPDSSEEAAKYSHIIEPIVPGHVVELSGIVGTDPKNPEQLTEGGIEHELNRIFDMIEAQLKEAGLSLKNVMKVEVKLAGPLTDDSGKNSSDFILMNEIYDKRVEGNSPKPARYTVGNLQLWHHARVELVVTAWRPDTRTD